MWDFFETVRHRHSIRQYQPDMPVEPEKISAVIEMACAAPSADGLQAYQIYAIQKPELRQKITNACTDIACLGNAPVVLCFCSHPKRASERFGERGRNLYALQDATIAAAYAQLAAVSVGLGSNWVGDFDEGAVRVALEVPEDCRPIALISMGYPAEIPAQTARRPIREILHSL